MANIFILDLKPEGSGLFLNSESFIDSMQDLSENELKMTFGGKGGKSKSSKSKSKSYSYYDCGCPCSGGGAGGGGAGAGA
jgi:hypothetical protein